jgi:predicted amidohydrolase YtcJ
VPQSHLRLFFICFLTFVFFANSPILRADDAASVPVKILFNARVFTAEPESPYADAVAIRGDKILAVGNLAEVQKPIAGANAERIDLHGKTLFPGFIDSHSHAIYGGISLISADATGKVRTMDELVKFVSDSKSSGVALSGDIVEIFSLPLEFWSHTDALNENFSAGDYKEQPVFLRGMDGHTGWAIPNLHVTGIKIFADGVVEKPSQTANLTKPYKNSGRNGELLFSPEKFAELCVAADKQGLIIHVHALGDGAVKAALDGIAAARKANPNSTLPHTLTHEQFVDPADFPRFREFGVISALQLLWAEAGPDTIELVKPYIDPEIYKWQYPARSLLNSGAIIAGASDWPVSSANVFWGTYQAETRKGPEGILDASQDMPRLAMFYAYTRNSARAMNLQDKIGSIAPGKRADLYQNVEWAVAHSDHV